MPFAGGLGNFGQNLLKGFFGSDFFKDYRHASRTFRSAGYENAPRLKFLYHVYFNLNTVELPGLRSAFSLSDASTLGVLVKNVQLPNYSFQLEEFNQYNRKRLVQSRINYEPVRVEFHDDSGDLIRNLWYKYFAYYYKDPSQPYNGVASSNNVNSPNFAPTPPSDYNGRDLYEPNRGGNDWGYIGEDERDGSKPYFFRDITIYGFNQHNFVSYTLVNPMIQSFNHDTYDYSAGGETMSNTMEIKYETVKYGSGKLGSGNVVPGFANPQYYDNEPSSLSRPGSTTSVLGKGGLVDAGIGVFEDLSRGSILGVLGAAQKAGRIYESVRRGDIGAAVREEGVQVLKDVLRGGANRSAQNDFTFNRPPRVFQKVTNIPTPYGTLNPTGVANTTQNNTGKITSNNSDIGTAV